MKPIKDMRMFFCLYPKAFGETGYFYFCSSAKFKTALFYQDFHDAVFRSESIPEQLKSYVFCMGYDFHYCPLNLRKGRKAYERN